MKVFRVETPDGMGVYRHSVAICHSQCSDYSRRVRPGPTCDGINTLTNQHYFGFQDLKQLKSWFTLKDRKSFRKYELVVNEYTVRKKFVLIGNRQVAFLLDKAKKVRTYDPYSLEVVDGKERKDAGVASALQTGTNRKRKKEKSFLNAKPGYICFQS